MEGQGSPSEAGIKNKTPNPRGGGALKGSEGEGSGKICRNSGGQLGEFLNVPGAGGIRMSRDLSGRGRGWKTSKVGASPDIGKKKNPGIQKRGCEKKRRRGHKLSGGEWEKTRNEEG